jgi:flagellar basal body-associated protein FliL
MNGKPKSKKSKAILIAVLLAVGIAASVAYVMYRSEQLKITEEAEKGGERARRSIPRIAVALRTRNSQPLFIEYDKKNQQVTLTDKGDNQMSFSLKELETEKPVFIRWIGAKPALATTLTEREIMRYCEISLDEKYTREEKGKAGQIALSDPRVKKIIGGKEYKIRMITGTYKLEGSKAIKTDVLLVGVVIPEPDKTSIYRIQVDLNAGEVKGIEPLSLGVIKMRHVRSREE